MSKPVLTYFKLAGRAEAIRLALSIGGTDFENRTVEFSDWPGLKPSTPLGQLPILELDGHTFTQSGAILRWAGRSAGLYPEGLDQLKVDEVIGVIDDVTAKVPYEKDEEAKKQKRAEYMEGRMTEFYKFIDSHIDAETGFVTGKLSIADLYLFAQAETIKSGLFDHIPYEFVERFPNVVRCIAAVRNHEGVKKYYASLE